MEPFNGTAGEANFDPLILYCLERTASTTSPGQAVLTTTASGTEAPAVRFTQKGCACRQDWMYLFFFLSPCSDSCCNPLGREPQDWCYVSNSSCEGDAWGYCASATTTPSTTVLSTSTVTRGTPIPGQTTQEGCQCREAWTFGCLGNRAELYIHINMYYINRYFGKPFRNFTCSSYCCNPDNDIFNWCLVLEQDCQGFMWGYCATVSTTAAPLTQAPNATAARFTQKGCACARNWTLSGYIPCQEYCCNPDSDVADWCFVLDENCEGTSWGYCGSTSTGPPTARVTMNGCACQSSWSYMELECSSGCCNPDNDVSDWCYVVDDQCEDSSWGYCAGSGDTATSTAGPVSFVPQSLVTRQTREGCLCQVYWEQPGSKPCAESCCNPDNDPQGAWCLVANSTCQDQPWGYCAEESQVTNPPMLPRYTMEGCLCQDRWMFAGAVPCLTSCCNPDGDVQDWCSVVDQSCQGANWGYCSRSCLAASIQCHILS